MLHDFRIGHTYHIALAFACGINNPCNLFEPIPFFGSPNIAQLRIFVDIFQDKN